MADVKDITLNRLIEEFQSLALANKFVSSFFYGDFADIIASNKIIHSAVLINTANGTIDENFITFQLEIAAMDKVFNDKSNQTEVESDAVQILQDIFSVVTYSKRWQSFSVFRGASPIRKFIQKGEDMATGWSMTLTLNIKRSNGICNIPVEDYDYEGDYAPSCAGVRIYEDGILVEVVPSGDRYDYSTGSSSIDITVNGIAFYVDASTDKNIPVKDEDLNNVGSKVGDNWIISDADQTFNAVSVIGQKPETTKVITVKDSGGNNVGTKVTDTALALDITIADSEIQINAVPVDQVEAESVLNIDVVDSTASPTGSWNGTAWEIDNSTININGNQIASTPPASIVNLNVHDLNGSDVGTINGLTVEIDDVTVDNSDVSYTVDIPAEGVFVLPDVTVTINGASQGSFPSVKDLSITASNIIYIRPANSGYGTTSYLTGDEGYNETNYPAPSAPAFGVPAYLDPSDPKMLLNNNAFGHKHRFTGVNGGYYDYNTAQYKLADGTVSDQATTFGTIGANTSYVIDNHTGLGWKWNIQGAGKWSTQVTNALASTHAGFSDWFLPSHYQYRSLLVVYNLSVAITSLIPFNTNQSVKTSTPYFGFETTNHFQGAAASFVSNRADDTADSAYFCRWHF